MSDKTKTLTHADLSRFTGDLERYRTLHRHVIYTPGVKFLAEQAGAFWLIDAITSYFCSRKMKTAKQRDSRIDSLQFWRLDVNDEDRTATLTARADSDVEPFVTQHIPYTDFPLVYVDIWAGFDGTYWTLYLPSEH